MRYFFVVSSMITPGPQAHSKRRMTHPTTRCFLNSKEGQDDDNTEEKVLKGL